MLSKKIEVIITGSSVYRRLQEEYSSALYLKIVRPPKNFGDYTADLLYKKTQKIKSPLGLVDNEIGGNLRDQEYFDLINDIKSSRECNKYFNNVNLARPCHINFFVKKSVLSSELNKVLEQKDRYGHNDEGEGKTVIVEYSSPNIAKQFGIGHLRSTIIGQAIYNLYKACGYKTIGINHLGDWGTQFGNLIYAIKTWGDEKEIAKNPVAELNKLYVKFHKEAEADSSIEEEGRKWFKKLEDGDSRTRALWKKTVKWSLQEFDRIYKLLGVKIDKQIGESFYESKLKAIIKQALQKGVAKESQGAIIISFPNDDLPPLMIRKSDGSTLYSTRDLATIDYRRKTFKPDKMIYEVGADQALYFQQLFWAAELMGFGKRQDYKHVAHGLVRWAGGKMSTRKGQTILLEEVLNESIKRALNIVVSKRSGGQTEAQAQSVAKAVGVGAIKYNDLSHHYSTDIVFDWNNILNLKGNSGPYLQYTYARAQSILKKADIKNINLPKIEFKQKYEIDILKNLIWFQDTVARAKETYSPNLLCNYLFELAQSFNSFYETMPILKEKQEALRTGRLALVRAVTQVLSNGLSILGIETLDKM